MGQEELGGCKQAVFGLHGRKVLVSIAGSAISVIFGINGLRNKLSCLVGPPFLVFMSRFQLRQVGISGRLDCKFVNLWVGLTLYQPMTAKPILRLSAS